MENVNELVKKFKDIGTKTIPKDSSKIYNTVEKRADHIVAEHIEQWSSRHGSVVIKLSDTSYGVLSFTRKEWSKITIDDDTWKCDCPSHRFGVYEECKHILAIKIMKDNGIHIPTEEEIMDKIYAEESK